MSKRSVVIIISTLVLNVYGVNGIVYSEPVMAPSIPDTAQVPKDSRSGGKKLLLGKRKEFANVLRSVKWKFGQISVCWENQEDARNEDLMLIRQSIAETWEDVSGVRFSGWASCTEAPRSAVKILLADVKPQTDGLGKELSEKPHGVTLNVIFKKYLKTPCVNNASVRAECIRGMAIHEFGHVLGFAHEQNREDTPDWCKDYTSGTNGDWTINVWDRDSVMNYCSSIQEGPQGWPLRQSLSETDVLAAQILYGIPGRH